MHHLLRIGLGECRRGWATASGALMTGGHMLMYMDMDMHVHVHGLDMD